MPVHRLAPVFACIGLLGLPAVQAANANLPTLNGQLPIVIGHRGAPGYLPDHTLAGYAKAIELGANYIEPDVVMTMDGHLIARHEPMLGGTTNVSAHAEFAGRKTTKLVDGVATTDWFASDFTLAEIKTLRAIQPLANRSQGFNGLYEIPTLNEVIALAQTQSLAMGRTIGIYPEIKHSTFHAALFGSNVFENKLLTTVHAAYGNVATAPVFIQSFEVSNLKYLNTQTQIKLVQLIDADDVNADGSMSLVAPYDKPYDFVVKGDARTFADLLTDKGLDELATYADAVGPWKPYLVKTVDDGIDRDGDNVLTIKDRRVDGPTGVIAAAHARGLLVHTWTFRNDRSGYGFADPRAEMAYYMNLGVDGVFTDFPDTGVAAVASVPEPETYALLALGLGLVVLKTRRRQ
jgi:glycerophosphoryl diester phosphodiesterase